MEWCWCVWTARLLVLFLMQIVPKFAPSTGPFFIKTASRDKVIPTNKAGKFLTNSKSMRETGVPVGTGLKRQEMKWSKHTLYALSHTPYWSEQSARILWNHIHRTGIQHELPAFRTRTCTVDRCSQRAVGWNRHMLFPHFAHMNFSLPQISMYVVLIFHWLAMHQAAQVADSVQVIVTSHRSTW